MILFCEDCGEKNDLDPSFFSTGRAVFTCARCGYANAYTVDMPKTESVATLTRFLKDILSFPEIIGAFFYHRIQGVIARQMPGMLNLKDLRHLGDGFADSYRAGASGWEDLQGMTVVISDKHFFVSRVGALYLIVAATSSPLPERVLKHIEVLEKQAWSGDDG